MQTEKLVDELPSYMQNMPITAFGHTPELQKVNPYALETVDPVLQPSEYPLEGGLVLSPNGQTELSQLPKGLSAPSGQHPLYE